MTTYTKTTWVNGGPPSISAANLNKLEQGVFDAHSEIAAIGAGGRSVTKIVAASDSTAQAKSGADYVCDGTADEVQINSALAALPAGVYGIVHLCAGNYSLSGNTSVDMNQDGMVIEGEGIDNTYVIAANPPGAGDTILFNITAAKCGLRYFTVHGRQAVDPVATRYAIKITGVANCYVDGMEVKETKGYGIAVDNCTSTVIKGCLFTSGLLNSAIEIIGGSTGTRVTNCTVNALNAVYGFFVTGSSLNTIEACYFYGAASNAHIHIENNSNSNVVNSCTFSGGRGVKIDGTTNGAVDNTVTTCGFYNLVGTPITFWNTTGCNAVGNTVRTCAASGILLHGGISNSITGNSINGNTGTTSGIHLESSTGENTIASNSIIASGQDGICVISCSYNAFIGNAITQAARWGMHLESADYNTITGNYLRRIGGDGIHLQASNHNNVIGNYVISPSQLQNQWYGGIYLYSNSTYNNVQCNTVRKGNLANVPIAAIQIDAGSNNNVVINNDLYDAANFVNNGTGTVTSAVNRT